MRNSFDNSKMRRQTGSMLVLIISITLAFVIPIIVLVAQLAPYLTFCGRAQNVVDAAGLLAARSLSSMVINDPHFGYISLSNHPAAGSATISGDGEPLPVTGINTLIGTLRQNALVAEQLQSDKMNSLIDQDLASLSLTVKSINRNISGALSESTRVVDANGKPVTPLADLRAFLSQNLPASLKLESIKLSAGWLDGGSDTTIEIPQSNRVAHVPSADAPDGKYPAFVQLPVGHHQFTFAGLGSQAHLVSNRNFREADAQHICSIIKIECTLVSTDERHTRSTHVVCCQPYAAPDQSLHGVMTMRFSGSQEFGGQCWRNFLSKDFFQDNKVSSYEIVNGDFPFDQEAKMLKSYQDSNSSTSDQFAAHLYYWLKNARLRPHFEAVMSMLNEPFSSTADNVYVYEPKDDGTIERKVSDGRNFARPVCADGQFTELADTKIAGKSPAIIFFRDNVQRQGSYSGKHAGQALAGYPLNGLDNWIDQNLLAGNFSKRRSNTNGLALDIEIGANKNTAMRDVMSMRHPVRHFRKI